MNSQDHKSAIVKNLFRSEPAHIPAWKRAIDITCCLIALPVLLIITLVMAVYFKFTAKGPVFFMQERIGYKGSRFMCYKFRTMTVGADTASHRAYCDNLIGSRAPMMKLDSKGDSRLIPLGWILRATGLDELPQVINILRKEMSVVGPRPCIQYEYEKYSPGERMRFNAVPGLTGLWQVSGKNRTTFDEMIALDIQYSETSSLGLDLRIIFMTIPSLVVQFADTRAARKSKARPARPMRSTMDRHSPAKNRPQTAVS